MRTATCLSGWCLAAATLVSLPVVAAEQPIPWWFEGGPVFRGGMSVKVNGGSYVQSLSIHATPGPLTAPASVGSKDSYADRIYQDGYVKLDAGTLDPNAVGGMGNTWNWAYNRPNQYNDKDQTLTFNQAGAAGYTTMYQSSGSMNDTMLGAGIQLNAGFNFYKSARWTIDMVIGFQGVWGANSQMGGSTYQERISKLHVRDSFAVEDVVDLVNGFPPPQTESGGYKGTYDGPAGGPSSWVGGFPTITNTPGSRVTSREDLGVAYNTVNYHVQTDFYELTFAPRFRYAASESLSLHLTPKLGGALVTSTASRTELFVNDAVGGGSTVLRSWSDTANSTQVRFALGVTAGADLELGHGYYTGVFAGYEWAFQPETLVLGPSQVSVSGSGYVAGAVFGKRF